ncbi:Tbingi protein [Diplonema papillatum]|nr:Tbingi protein [Diplonema papillatum]KAJ9448960.1 Tbingi protein [Diplonema papillatum]
MLLVFDLARAFDTVDHARLENQMVERGILLKLIRWVESFLKDRNSIVRVTANTAPRQNSRAVFLKGQYWILFLLYIDDLGDDLVKLKDATASPFADDVGAVATGRTTAEMAKTCAG